MSSTRRRNPEEFVAAAKAIHGSIYDYSSINYTNNRIPVAIICPHHGKFFQAPSNHLAGKACRKCASEKASNRYRKSRNSFVAKARSIHGDVYDYTLVDYAGARQKVEIVCKSHGTFQQSPDAHQRGQGCPKCSNEKTSKRLNWTLAVFLNRARKKFGNLFGYSKVSYIDAWTPVIITCHQHGDFSQRPATHLHAATYGCPKCAHEAIAGKSRLTSEDFLIRAKKLHRQKYDYSKAVLRDSKQKIKILCPTHGLFEQSPSDHLGGRGCPTCRYDNIATKLRQSPELFIDRARKIHGNKYDYSKLDYRTARTRVTIICPIHGEFRQTPDTHLVAGCRKCADEALPGAYTKKRFSTDPILGQIIGVIYYVQFSSSEGESFFKIGISKDTATKRFAGYAGSYRYKMKLLASRSLPLAEAYEIEQRIINDFVSRFPYTPHNLSKTGRRFGGKTECFSKQLPRRLRVLIACE